MSQARYFALFLCVIFVVIGLVYGNYGHDKTFRTNRLQPEDLEYLGAFRLPDGSSASYMKTWNYGGHALTLYPYGDPLGTDDGYPGSIFGMGHAWEHQISEISIPKPVISPTKNVEDLNTAVTLQDFQDILNVSHLEIPRSGLAYLPRQGAQNTAKLHFCWGRNDETS